MMMTFDTRENFRELIAAVHNADLTCRAQILAREHNPPMHDILSAFERRTGGGVILNTSFNLHGFPIVRTPAEALAVLRDSGLEYLQARRLHRLETSPRRRRTAPPSAIKCHVRPPPRLSSGNHLLPARRARRAGPVGLQSFHRPTVGNDCARRCPARSFACRCWPSRRATCSTCWTFRPRTSYPCRPLKSVIRSQVYYFQTRRILRQFARKVDVLFIRVPFQLPTALLDLGKPKLLHVAGNPYKVIAASSDYHGLMKRLALGFAAHSNRTLQRMVGRAEDPRRHERRRNVGRARCRAGRVVVSSCLYEREMRPRENRALGDPPRLLFVGYLRPEKGIHNLLDAFEQFAANAPLKLTLVGGTDKTSGAEGATHQRIRNSPYRDDIQLTGMLEFGEPLFDLYRSHDVFVLPSLSEGTPRTLVEARSFGCPGRGHACWWHSLFGCSDGKNGLLVEPQRFARAWRRPSSEFWTTRRCGCGLIDAGLHDCSRHSRWNISLAN